ncbi:hypothetical protein BDY19DRAFT_1057532 [Irpex rosettiformis]|uniref:Uncharacterized protein n=1 Tax=Irpex rosettiformis TaxID=378272 RepID=A0ACB8U2J4_9APHY|nr:hypothetical protein BDY19DRAFT_1057532 [Irpex rosettiformis]
MQSPASCVASSPTFQSLSSQQSSTTSLTTHNIPTGTTPSPSYTASIRDTTLAVAARLPNQTPPSAPSIPSSAPDYSSVTSTPSMAGTQMGTSTTASQPSLPSVDSGSDTRHAVGGSDVPIDLRGLFALPSSNGIPASTAVFGAPRTINLPTLKNPQGELLDLNELAGFGDGLSEFVFLIVMAHSVRIFVVIRFEERAITPTQETFSIHSPPTFVPHNVSQPFIKPLPTTHDMASAGFTNSPTYHSQATFTSASAFSPNPSLASFPSLPSLTSVQSSLSSLTSTPSIASEPSPSIGSDTDSVSAGLKTPNVYINGLPPNFPEEDLLAMTKPFGEVISVRTFTRHVSDKPSGYGFVLFGSVHGAERCIESLRKYRNLHPSFSKQIHKIPGTSYAAIHADTALNLPSRTDETPDSFKSKMERLKDPSSTNLYMEGLPLSIDEPTLQALVNPYRIMSSRFFRTRLSNPPRIIAFVRLESREAAEEVIERLHGRMVRGWCDAGSRISVRFADTSEQRELRRVERVNRDGENSPARLTMAQAALLNLKGTQMGNATNPRLPGPNFGAISLPPVIGTAVSVVEPAFVATVEGLRPLPPPIGLHHQSSVDPPMLRGSNGLPYDSSALGLVPPNAHSDYVSSDDLLQAPMAGMDIGSKPLLSTRAQNGFTPMEKLILQAHEQRQRQEALAIATGGAFVQTGNGSGAVQGRYGKGLRTSEFNPSATEFSPSVPSLGRLRAPVVTSAESGSERRRLVDFLPAMSEQDFHARASQQRTAAKLKLESNTLRLDQESRAQFTRQRNQTHAEAKAQAEAEARAAHARSTTVPSHYLHTDISRSLLSDLHPVTSTSAIGSNTQACRNNLQNDACDINSPAQSHSKNTSNVTRNVGQGGVRQSNIPTSNTNVHSKSIANGDAQQQQTTRIDTDSSAVRSRPSASHGEDEDDGSGLDSPALSYSARTPASLSPTTPFSAFGETFDGPPMTTGEVGLGVGVGGTNEMTNIGTSKSITTSVGTVFADVSATSEN